MVLEECKRKPDIIKSIHRQWLKVPLNNECIEIMFSKICYFIEGFAVLCCLWEIEGKTYLMGNYFSSKYDITAI